MGGGPFGMPGGNQQPSPDQVAAREKVLASIRDFKMLPRDVKRQLDRYVVEQHSAKKVLSVAICDHYNWARRCIKDPSLREVNYAKPNILILGPTGCGKTYLVKNLAKMLGVPFVKADATKFSETGIVGEDAEDVVRNLVDAAGGDVDLAQYGMVYIDEVDKIAGGGRGAGGGWNSKQVQSNFLKIMEDTEISAKSSMQSQMSSMMGGGAGAEQTISTKFVLFIFSGAFNSMNDLVKSRVGKQSIGFAVDAGDDGSAFAEEEGAQSLLHLAETSDFIEAGLEPEFIGRVPVRVAIDALKADDMYRILTEAEDSVFKQYKQELQGYGIELRAEEAALRHVSELAVKEKLGARSLVTIMEKALREFKFELPSTSCTELVLTKELIENPTGTLGALLCAPEQAANDLQRWLEDAGRTSQVRIDMEDGVRKLVVEQCGISKRPAEALLEERFRATGVLAALQRIREATGGAVDLYMITKAMYDSPKEEIDKLLAGLSSMKPQAVD